MKESILITTGMHRSGTSLTASLLQSAGLNVGERLMGGAFSNVKGHFENLDFVEFHESILNEQGLSKAGWTLQNDIDVPQEYIEIAKQLVEENKSTSCWGWKDPRTTLFLDFWAELLPEANFLFVYRSPTEVVDSLYRRGDEIFYENPTFAVELWMHYNKNILNILNKYPEKCILININSITKNPDILLNALSENLGINLDEINENIYEENLLRTRISHHSQLMRNLFPEALNIYDELNAKAEYTNDSDVFDSDSNDSYSVKDFYFQDWLELRWKEKDIAKYKSQLQETQKELADSQKHLQQTEKELTNYQMQLQETQKELADSQKRLQQTQKELADSEKELTNYQMQLQDTQKELTYSQTKLQQTQTNLEQFEFLLNKNQIEKEQLESQIERMQTQLQNSHFQLQNNQNQLEQLQHQLQQTQIQLQLSQNTIKAMETSKFWILRSQWFKLKQALNKSSSIFIEISPSGDIEGCLETPSHEEENKSSTLLISGWVFHKVAKIKSLILLIDNLPEKQIEYGLYRPDVSQVYKNQPGADSSGFMHSLELDTKNSGNVDINIFAVLETGETICCFARRVFMKNQIKEETNKSNQFKKIIFIRNVLIKGFLAFKERRLPLSPKLWIYYIQRYYKKTQYQQNVGIEYSDVIHSWQTQDPYQRWIKTNKLTPKLLAWMREDAAKLGSIGAKISIVVPVYNTSNNFLIEMIDSVRNQIYPNWELCIADDASNKPHVKQILQSPVADDSRIKVIFREQNGHIVKATNSALEIATGEYIALLDHDDTLPCDALLHVAECINKHPEVDWIYTDEDKINESGHHFDPQMKGEWSPEMAITHNFTHHLTVIRKTLIEQVEGMREGYEGAQDLDLFVRVAEKTTPERIRHLPHICYHWRTHVGSTASHGTQKQYVFDSAYRAIKDAIQRRGLKAKLFLPKIAQKYGLCLYQLQWDNSLLAENHVTIVIPTRDRVDLLEKCITSLEKTVDKRFVKLLIIDDSSTESATHRYFQKLQKQQVLESQVIRAERKVDVFNYARLMNLALQYIDTPYILHLNNDVQAIEPGWLEDMVGWMSVEGVGVVGAKLLYPNNIIQHAGVVIGSHNGLADHLFNNTHIDEVGYICLPHAARNVSAVTGACLLTSTKLYRQLAGFDEENFAVEYNDIDYCLRSQKLGKRIVYTPQAKLIHQTSASRGNKYNPKEHINFTQKYKDFVDPFFSKNLDINSMSMAVNPYAYSHINRVSKAKILFITHNLNLEGAPLIIFNYARYFATVGNCDITVVSPSDGVLRQNYENLSIDVQFFKNTLPIPGESLEEYRKRLKEFGDKLNLQSFDLVACNTLLSFWGIELSKIFNLPSLWHIHESKSINMSINSFFGNASEEIMEKILPDCLTNATRVIFQANATRKIFHEYDKKDNFRTIPGGIDLETIKHFRDSHSKSELRDKYGINQQHIVISIIGTTCERKGQHIFIQAIKELQSLLPENFDRISCLIVGARDTTSGDKSFLNLLESKIEELSLDNLFIYHETKDVYDFYALSDIFVCASFEESFPRVLLEAMAFELKIVSTYVFGIPEIISDESEGYLVEAGNPKALAAAIRKCIIEAELSSDFAKNGFAKVCRMFDNCHLLRENLLLAFEAILNES
ncbi:MAG: glycosyltransferase [Cyanobacteria bacterium P01_D01_bin.50]